MSYEEIAIESTQVQMTRSLISANVEVTGISQQIQSSIVELAVGVYVGIESSQAQGNTGQMRGMVSLDASTSTSQSTSAFIPLVWVDSAQAQSTSVLLHLSYAVVTGQAQSALIETVMAITAAMRSSQAQTGLLQPVNYMPAPEVTTCRVPAEIYTVWVPAYANGVIVPPELPEAVESEETIDAIVPEYVSEAVITEIENSAAVPA